MKLYDRIVNWLNEPAKYPIEKKVFTYETFVMDVLNWYIKSTKVGPNTLFARPLLKIEINKVLQDKKNFKYRNEVLNKYNESKDIFVPILAEIVSNCFTFIVRICILLRKPIRTKLNSVQSATGHIISNKKFKL